MSSEASSEITITVKGPSELKLSITIDTSKSVLELKEAIAAKSDVEKDRQRLIYSGKVLKDEEPISTYKIQNGNTIHMVKGAAKNAATGGAGAAGSSSTSQPLPAMGTGLNVAGNPIDNIENIPHGLGGFNPFAGMQGMNNLQDPNAMAGLMNSPEFMQGMAEMMSRPEIVEQMVAANPQLAGMAPQIRQMMQNPMVRQMLSNPDTLRMMMQMQSSMGGGSNPFGGMGGMGGMGGFGGLGGAGAGGARAGGDAVNDPFPNLFNPGATAPPSGGQTGGAGATPGSPPAAGTGGAANAPPNPFAGLFGSMGPLGGMGAGAVGAGAGAGAGGQAGGAAGQNPFMNPFMFGGFPPAQQAPRDERPPEEIYATQLGQLSGMGMYDAQKNIRALRMTGGNVEAAIELIFSGQLD